MSYTDKYKVDVPEGESGIWKVERFTVSKDDARMQSMRAMFSGGRGVPEGTYTKLMRGKTLVMSDTPDEVRDHLQFMSWATGDVLIAGLGLGMVTRAVAIKDDVRSVTVIEQSPDVIKLVADHYKAQSYGHKLQIIEDDIFTWKPPKDGKWDCAWFDVWDYLCTDNLKEMAKLHRRFARKAETKGSWGKELLKRQRAQERRHELRWYYR